MGYTLAAVQWGNQNPIHFNVVHPTLTAKRFWPSHYAAHRACALHAMPLLLPWYIRMDQPIRTSQDAAKDRNPNWCQNWILSIAPLSCVCKYTKCISVFCVSCGGVKTLCKSWPLGQCAFHTKSPFVLRNLTTSMLHYFCLISRLSHRHTSNHFLCL